MKLLKDLLSLIFWWGLVLLIPFFFLLLLAFASHPQGMR